MGDAILCLNAGSSTIKFALFDAVDGYPTALFRGAVEGVDAEPRLRAWARDGRLLEDGYGFAPDADAESFTGEIVRWAQARLGEGRLAAVSHRVVHGGDDFTGPVVITPPVLARLEAFCPLAPLHQPHNLAVVREAQALAPDARHVACFDTSFHRTLPKVAQRIPLPSEWEARGVKRYGFHGLSYSFLVDELARRDPAAAKGRTLLAHLGSGASLCAARDGVSIDTTMGFSALDGLVMSTRCGTLDPGVALFLLSSGLTGAQIEDLLYRKSGLLAVSGSTGDMRALLASDAPAAGQAVELFVYRLLREAGGMLAALGGLDTLVFSAGIGENAAEIRRRMCEGLSWMGVRLDLAANARPAGRISAPGSAVSVWVIPTNEELVLAQGAARLL